MRTLCALGLMMLSCAARAAAAGGAPAVEHIIWLQADASKPNPIVAYLAKQLPEIKHEPLATNALRSWQMIERGEHACRPTTVRTAAREAQAYFADTMLAPPAELIVRRDKLTALPRNAAGEVDLETLLRQGRLQGAYLRGRSFGERIDSLLQAQASNKSLTDYATAGFGTRLQDMLAHGRSDYLIDAQGALEQMRRRELAADDFVGLPIQGSTAPLVLGIACPRTPWGLAAIRTIDRTLGTPAGAEMLRQTGRAWLDADTAERLRPQFDEFYLRRSKPQYQD
ncbi:hypothetical protein RQP53_04115 [Paucibacter sp. APW11]|uniref:Solute-binding protein family 3/N-terminal domain-containing protein n=1 Tax=Roseateles aquae TaxID=3077235 RepID=A0ABU3P785_9BURK|nr:hypothetical protein [Paucibacter sp. APW11]MDT8998457.1 hypothetical protein [Paucibacter sp. APW11]